MGVGPTDNQGLDLSQQCFDNSGARVLTSCAILQMATYCLIKDRKNCTCCPVSLFLSYWVLCDDLDEFAQFYSINYICVAGKDFPGCIAASKLPVCQIQRVKHETMVWHTVASSLYSVQQCSQYCSTRMYLCLVTSQNFNQSSVIPLLDNVEN